MTAGSPLPHGSDARVEVAAKYLRQYAAPVQGGRHWQDHLAAARDLLERVEAVPSPGVRASEKGAERSGAPASEAEEAETDWRTREVVAYVASTIDGALHIHRGTGICEPINPEDLVVHVLSQAGFHTLLRERDEAREALRKAHRELERLGR